MKRILASVLASVFPIVAFAQYQASTGITGLFGLFGLWLKMALPLLVSLAVVWFMWNVFQYAIAGDEDTKAKAKGGIIWGIVGIFIMVSIWGLVGILSSTFFGGGSGTTTLPTLPV